MRPQAIHLPTLPAHFRAGGSHGRGLFFVGSQGLVPFSWNSFSEPQQPAASSPIVNIVEDEGEEPAYVQGYATVYNRVHAYRGRLEVFCPGAFDSALKAGAKIHALLAHDWGKALGSNADRLEIYSDSRGLAFRLRLDDSLHSEFARAKVEDGSWRGMSVGYNKPMGVVRTINGQDVHFITEAELTEISLCPRGAVKQAHSSLVVGTQSESLRAVAASGLLVLERLDRDVDLLASDLLAAIDEVKSQAKRLSNRGQ